MTTADMVGRAKGEIGRSLFGISLYSNFEVRNEYMDTHYGNLAFRSASRPIIKAPKALYRHTATSYSKRNVTRIERRA